MALFRGGCVVCRSRSTDALCTGCTAGLTPGPTTTVRGVGTVPALFAYEGTGARVVQALKFRDGRRLVGPLADRLADVLSAPDQPAPSALSWVPTTPRRRRSRGFDQAELLASAVARRLGVPCVATLRRNDGPAQTGQTREARNEVSFRATGRPPGAVVLVDDVCTTGATLRAATAALGGSRVRCAVVARTP